MRLYIFATFGVFILLFYHTAASKSSENGDWSLQSSFTAMNSTDRAFSLDCIFCPERRLIRTRRSFRGRSIPRYKYRSNRHGMRSSIKTSNKNVGSAKRQPARKTQKPFRRNQASNRKPVLKNTTSKHPATVQHKNGDASTTTQKPTRSNQPSTRMPSIMTKKGEATTVAPIQKTTQAPIILGSQSQNKNQVHYHQGYGSVHRNDYAEVLRRDADEVSYELNTQEETKKFSNDDKKAHGGVVVHYSDANRKNGEKNVDYLPISQGLASSQMTSDSKKAFLGGGTALLAGTALALSNQENSISASPLFQNRVMDENWNFGNSKLGLLLASGSSLGVILFVLYYFNAFKLICKKG